MTECSPPSISEKSPLLHYHLSVLLRRRLLRLHLQARRQWNVLGSLLDSVSVRKTRRPVSPDAVVRVASNGLEFPSVLRGEAMVPPLVIAKVMANPTPSMAQLVLEYNEGLNAALETLDENVIRTFYRNWNGDDLHPDKEIFWVAIHKTITGRKSLDLAFRRASKVWLDSHNQRSLDDGELSWPQIIVDGEDVPF